MCLVLEPWLDVELRQAEAMKGATARPRGHSVRSGKFIPCFLAHDNLIRISFGFAFSIYEYIHHFRCGGLCGTFDFQSGEPDVFIALDACKQTLIA